MATDFNAIFNNLIPLLLQAKQQRIANERKDKQLQLQAQQQATTGRQRERQLNITEENADKQLKQKERHYLGNTYDGLSWLEKKVWVESGNPIPSGVSPVSELRMINTNIQIEDTERQEKIDFQDLKEKQLNFAIGEQEREDKFRKLPFAERRLVMQQQGLEQSLAIMDADLMGIYSDEDKREREQQFSQVSEQLEIMRGGGGGDVIPDDPVSLRTGEILDSSNFPSTKLSDQQAFFMIEAILNTNTNISNKKAIQQFRRLTGDLTPSEEGRIREGEIFRKSIIEPSKKAVTKGLDALFKTKGEPDPFPFL